MRTMEHYQYNRGKSKAAVEVIIVRAAREGIPINALARILGYNRSDLKRYIKQAFDDGKVFQIPPDDWPSEAERAPSSEMVYRGYEDQDVAKACHKFGLSVGEGCLLMCLMKKAGQFCSNKTLFKSAAKDPERVKGNLVSVTVCKLRKKLKPFGIVISRKTAVGYMVTVDQSQLIKSLMLDKGSDHERTVEAR
jgi:DNA-binding winged helix-turn-helix (wHTH) protein